MAQRLLQPLGARWRHTLGVAGRARVVGGVLERREANVLLAAAFLHDVGYAQEVSRTGFHPLDGARFVRSLGRERLAGLVAYHSGAEAEAAERGLLGELAEFEDERSFVSRALSYCDLTTGPDGRPVDATARIAEIRERYGPQTPEARALKSSRVALLEDVRLVESIVSASVGGRGRS